MAKSIKQTINYTRYVKLYNSIFIPLLAWSGIFVAERSDKMGGVGNSFLTLNFWIL